MWTFEQGSRTSAFIGDVAALNCHCFFRDSHAYDWLRILDDLSGRFDDRAAIPRSRQLAGWHRGARLAARLHCAFLHSVARLEGVPIRPVEACRENVIAVMKDYLPADATLFLLDYELEKTIPRYLPS